MNNIDKQFQALVAALIVRVGRTVEEVSTYEGCYTHDRPRDHEMLTRLQEALLPRGMRESVANKWALELNRCVDQYLTAKNS